MTCTKSYVMAENEYQLQHRVHIIHESQVIDPVIIEKNGPEIITWST